MKCDAWEVVVPELVFEPDEQFKTPRSTMCSTATAGAQASCSDWNTKAFFCRLASLTFPVA